MNAGSHNTALGAADRVTGTAAGRETGRMNAGSRNTALWSGCSRDRQRAGDRPLAWPAVPRAKQGR